MFSKFDNATDPRNLTLPTLVPMTMLMAGNNDETDAAEDDDENYEAKIVCGRYNISVWAPILPYCHMMMKIMKLR